MKKVFLFLISSASVGALHAQVKHAPVKHTQAKTTQATQASVSRPQTKTTATPQAQQAEVKEVPVKYTEVRYVPVSSPVVRHKAAARRSFPMTFGVKGGMNVAKIGGPDASGFKAKIGFNAGGFVNIPLAENFSIQPELLFSLQGGKVNGYDELGRRSDIKFNMSYINMPVMARYTTDFGLYGETGPQIGFLVGAKEKAGGDSESLMDQLKKVDFGWSFGAGYLTDANIGFNARYNLGLSKVGIDGVARRRNNVFQVGVFYVIGSTK